MSRLEFQVPGIPGTLGKRLHACAVLTVCVVLGVAGSAQATTWYVDKTGSNANSCTVPGAAGACQTINGALGKAGVTDSDTISIGPGDYDEGVTTSKSLNFVGAGPGTATGFDPATDTVIDATGGGAFALRVDNAGGSVSNIRLLGASDAEAVTSGEGLFLNATTPGSALTYQVTSVVAIGGLDAGGADQEGLRIDDGGAGRTLDASVTGSYFSSPENALPVVRVSGTNVSALVQTSTIAQKTAALAVFVDGGASLTLDASQVTPSDASGGGVVATDPTTALNVTHSVLAAREGFALALVEGATADVIDSLIWLQPDPFQVNPGIQDAAASVQSVYFAGVTSQLTATGSTFVARANGVEAAVGVGCPTCVGGSVANLRNSIMRATDTDASPGDADLLADGGPATVSATNSFFSDRLQANGGTATEPGSGLNAGGDPLFVDEAGGNFTLQSGSPAIDRGDPTLVSPGELDLAGNARAQAFFFDCVIAPDSGAYELVGAPAACTAATQPPVGPAESEPALVISSHRVRVSRKRVARIDLRCEGSDAGRCDGKLTLTTKKRFALRTRSKRQRKQVRLGSARVSLAAGESARAPLRVTRRALALLRRKRSLRVTASAVTHVTSGGDRTTRALMTVTAPKSRSSRR